MTRQEIQAMNHPQKGSKIKVQPIMDLKDIKTIKQMLQAKPMYRALFIIGINTGLRASDILNLKVNQVNDLKPGDNLEIVEKKSQKYRRLTLNKSVVESIQALLISKPYTDDDYLFTGQRGLLTVPSVTRLVKSWCKAINLKGNYGSHTLRKTWGYHQRVTFKVDLPTIQNAFGHAYQRETLIYLCIQPEEIQNMYKNEL